MWIAVISNTTEGLHPAVEGYLGEIEFDWILHCGNIGSSEVLLNLSEHAPTTGILGPRDDAGELPFQATLTKTIGGCMFYMANDTGTPFRPNGATARVLEESSPQVVLSHCNGEASTDIVNGVYWVSPGNAGLDAVDCSVTVIEVRGGQPYFEVVDLESGPG